MAILLESKNTIKNHILRYSIRYALLIEICMAAKYELSKPDPDKDYISNLEKEYVKLAQLTLFCV